MMRFFHGIIISVSLAACATPPQRGIPMVKYSEKELFRAQRGIASETAPYFKNTYVSLDLPYTAYEKLRSAVEVQESLELKHRGEAHLTLITPPEMKALKQKLSEKEIIQFLQTQNIEKLSYKPTCVGKSQVNSQMRTYYVIVDSEKAYEIRHRLHNLFTSRGGNPASFDPEEFYPHVTLGFTDRDLHIEDGIKKDASTCILALQDDSQKI